MAKNFLEKTVRFNIQKKPALKSVDIGKQEKTM